MLRTLPKLILLAGLMGLAAEAAAVGASSARRRESGPRATAARLPWLG